MTIWHPLVQPNYKGATAKSNCQDIEFIRALPETERGPSIDAMIKRNISLVNHKVEICIGIYPHAEFLSDDLVSEGLCALTKAVQDLAKLETPSDGGNPSAYIGQRIIWAITRLIELEEKQQQIPHNDWLRNKQVYAWNEKPVICEFDGVITQYVSVSAAARQTDYTREDISRWCHSGSKSPGGSTWYFNYHPLTQMCVDPTEMIEMQDSLASICQTPEDVIILEMREQGSTDLEIAARLDIPRSAVRVQRHELLKRYEALEKASL